MEYMNIICKQENTLTVNNLRYEEDKRNCNRFLTGITAEVVKHFLRKDTEKDTAQGY